MVVDIGLYQKNVPSWVNERLRADKAKVTETYGEEPERIQNACKSRSSLFHPLGRQGNCHGANLQARITAVKISFLAGIS